MFRGLLGAALAGEFQQVTDRARRAALLLSIAAVAIAVGVGFLIGACYLLAARQFGNLEASIGFGVAFIVIGLLCLLANRLAARHARQKRKLERGPELRGLAIAGALAALPTLLRHPKALLPVVALPALGLVAMKIADENRSPAVPNQRDPRSDPSAWR